MNGSRFAELNPVVTDEEAIDIADFMESMREVSLDAADQAIINKARAQAEDTEKEDEYLRRYQ